jgi:hypothetical protein
MYGIDVSVIPETVIGSRETMPNRTSAIPAVIFIASAIGASNEKSSEGSRNSTFTKTMFTESLRTS